MCVHATQVRVSEYNQLKGQLAALNRKRTGNLAVRELAGLVDKEDAVATENLMSLFVVVPKTSKADWTGGYERLSDFVVGDCCSWGCDGSSLVHCNALQFALRRWVCCLWSISYGALMLFAKIHWCRLIGHRATAGAAVVKTDHRGQRLHSFPRDPLSPRRGHFQGRLPSIWLSGGVLTPTSTGRNQYPEALAAVPPRAADASAKGDTEAGVACMFAGAGLPGG